MRFKEISIDDVVSTSNYTTEQGRALKNISKKINLIGEFFDQLAKLENFVIKSFYTDYINLIKIRENRSEIEKIGGSEVYINDYFLPAAKKLNDRINIAISEWNAINQTWSLDIMHSRIEKLKKIRKNIEKQFQEQDFVGNICSLLDSFAHFKIYKVLTLETTLDRIEILLRFKDDLVSVVESEDSVKEIKSKPVSIDDL